MTTSAPRAAGPSQSEGDVNSSPRRAAGQREHLDEATRALLARDGAAFLHQSVSTPCLSAIRWVSFRVLNQSAPPHCRQVASPPEPRAVHRLRMP